MKKHTAASKRKHPDSAQVGCSPRCHRSNRVPYKKMRVGLQSDTDCNPKTHDDNGVVSSALSPQVQVKPMLNTPEKPNNSQFQGDSLLESLPADLLVDIICYMNHEDLGPVSLVSHTMHHAVMDAKAIHFYKTPDRSRQQVLKGKDLASKDERYAMLESPQCPGAPVQGRACIYLQK